MRLGYLRVTGEGANNQELRVLEAAECGQILIDSVPGGRSKAVTARIKELKSGDELVVVRLNHLAAMPGLLDLLVDLVARGVVVQSLSDEIRTTDPGVIATVMLLGRYQFQPAIGQHRQRGRTPALNAADLERARQMIHNERLPVAKVASTLGVSRATLYRHLPAA